ncbi:Leucine efflux protein [Actinomadura sp. RB68]|uniref:Leucine efflux protein n=2 Tax=Actinomadura macrotermitis TaxID=2585200 RepID=A0A7K0C2T6_9ACTN|nr:Leucine efflux protein [Actinomadura macrotermitis]
MLTFSLAALVLIMIPGPDQALITKSALTGGRRAGLLTTLGGVLGLAVHATAAAAGLSALLLASATAFTAMKIVGAVYLVWMGVQTLRAAARARREGAAEEPVERSSLSGRTALRQGFLSNALNPKIALFFVTFLPQFLDPHAAAPWARALLLSLVFAVLYLAWFTLYVGAVDRLGRWLRRPKVKRGIERVTGVLLIGFAVRLATAHQG